jgi:hypothetical protein
VVNHPHRKKTERAVLVTTGNRGVFFGYATDTSGENITLKRARNCIQWRGLKGFLDLSVTGPTAQCRVGPAAATFDARNVTGVAECSPEAIAAWESAPWRK